MHRRRAHQRAHDQMGQKNNWANHKADKSRSNCGRTHYSPRSIKSYRSRLAGSFLYIMRYLDFYQSDGDKVVAAGTKIFLYFRPSEDPAWLRFCPSYFLLSA